MNRRDFSRLMLSSAFIPALSTPASASGRHRAWSFRANLAESCTCPIPCPCNFGRPTDRGCFGNRLISIQEGSIEGTDLAGGRFLITFSMGQWSRLYLDSAMSTPLTAAMDALLPLAFGGLHRSAQEIQRVPILEERTATTVKFSVPESSVDMKMLAGLDGNPIRISNLPNPAYQNYVQYESVAHVHRSPSANWSHSATNGFTSEMRASG
jgi:hypothetical protein